MMNVILSIFKNIGALLYKQGGTAILVAVLFMFAWSYARENGWHGREAVKRSAGVWMARFRDSGEFRRVFLLAVYVSMMLLRTVLMRDFYAHPLAKFMGGWGLYDEYGGMTAESIENIMLFVPFAFLLMWVRRGGAANGDVQERSFRGDALYVLKVCAGYSFGIECVQLLLHSGTFQLSDLCYNTLGGAAGILFYFVIHMVYRSVKRKS